MFKNKKLFYTLILIVLLLGAGAWGYLYIYQNQSDTNLVSKGPDKSYYEGVWADTFRNYQYSTTHLPAKGKFDFLFGVSATGDLSELDANVQKSGINAFGSGFQNLDLKIKGQYDFQNLDKAFIAASLKIYFNSQQKTGTGDLDVMFKISSDGKIVYVINSLDRFLLKNFGLSDQMVEDLISVYGENKGKQFTYFIPKDIMAQIISSIKNSSESSPLYQNSKDQEKAIIDAFLKDKVIDVITGSQQSDGTDVIVSEFNTNNFVNFLNNVSKVISTGSDIKNFDNEKELMKQFTLGCKFWIKDKILNDSKFATEIPIKSVNNQTGKEEFRLLLLDTDFKMLNPQKFDMDLTNSIYWKDKPDNKVIITIKGLIN